MLIKRDRPIERHQQPKDEGFTLIESVSAMVILGICAAYAMPLILYARLNNAKTESRTGALMVAQRVFDKVRAQNITDISPTLAACKMEAGALTTAISKLPTTTIATNCFSDTANFLRTYSTTTTTTTPITTTYSHTDAGSALPAAPAQKNMDYTALGKKYATRVSFCVDTTNDCDANSRKFQVEVFGQDGSKIYELSGTYANFE
jgi:prepilin-type N-terminal cleavage/methylation domain-containing protein